MAAAKQPNALGPVTESANWKTAKTARTIAKVTVIAGAFQGPRRSGIGGNRTIQIEDGKHRALTQAAIIQSFSLFPWVKRAAPIPTIGGATASSVRRRSARITRADKATRHRMMTDARGSAMIP